MAQRTAKAFGYLSQELPPIGRAATRQAADARARLTPAPTIETQTLYDNMKETESELDLVERLGLQGGPGSDIGQAEFLETATHSQRTTISRSPSLHSNTRSIVYSTNLVDIGDVVEQEERAGGRRKRAMRRGPLDKYTKARAALLRKLGACDSCRERKVKVRSPFSLGTSPRCNLPS